MQMDVGLDTGDMLIKTVCPILNTDSAAILHDRLLSIGAPALLEALEQIQLGTANPIKQDDSLSNYAPKLSKEEAALDWNLSAAELERKVRAFNPFPVAHSKIQGASDEARIRVWAANSSDITSNAAIGSITQIDDEGLWVACKNGQLILKNLQLAGKKALSSSELLRGQPKLFNLGDQLELPKC